MRPAIRWIAGLLAVLAISAAYYHQDEDKDKPAVIPAQEVDKAIFDSLRDVINRGAEVYNDGDHAGCYRIFEGALRSVKPLLARYPDLQKLIAEKLTAAEADPVVWRRAFTLRSGLDKVREKLNPNPKKPDDRKADKDNELKGKPKEQAEKDKKKDDQDKDKKDAGEAKKKKDDEDKKKKEDEDKEKDKDEKDKKDKDKKDKDNQTKAERLPLPEVEKNG